MVACSIVAVDVVDRAGPRVEDKGPVHLHSVRVVTGDLPIAAARLAAAVHVAVEDLHVRAVRDPHVRLGDAVAANAVVSQAEAARLGSHAARATTRPMKYLFFTTRLLQRELVSLPAIP